MTRGKKIFVAANVVVVGVAAAWVYFHPAWDSWTALVVAIAVLVGAVVDAVPKASGHDSGQERRSEMGKGGSAIRGGRVGKLAVENKGEIRAGRGGDGGDGGHAIHIDDGLDVTIINNGVIAGGDAGRSAAFVEKQVNFQFPEESGLQGKLEGEGFSVAWCNRSRVEQLRMQGWQIVEVDDSDGRSRFCLKNSVGEDQILIKRKIGAP